MADLFPRLQVFKPPRLRLALVSFVLAALPLQVLAQSVAAPTDLLSGPESGSKLVGTLPAKTSLKIITRQGFWLEVEANGKRGWLKSTSVQFGGGSKPLGGLDTGRSGKGNIVSTSAARGLSSKELIAAKPDLAEVDRMEKLAVSSQDALNFAGKANLQVRKLAFLQVSVEHKAKVNPDGASAKPRKLKKSSEEDDEDE